MRAFVPTARAALLSICVLICALFVAACEPKLIDAETQIMLRIDADAELRAQLTQLDVRVSLRQGETWKKPPATAAIPASQLKWPVDIPITPRSAEDALKQFEVVVDAREGDHVLAQTRAISGFLSGERRVLNVLLRACPGLANGSCAAADCEGLACQTCGRDGVCVAVSTTEAERLPVLSWPASTMAADGGNPTIETPDAEVTEREAAAPAAAAADAGGAELDAGGRAPDATLDASSPSDADPNATYALATQGQACSAEQAFACDGHASARVLQCRGRVWTLAKTCAASERCDSRVSTQPGVCLPVPAACVDQAPGDVCEGTARVTCGIDLVSVDNHACPSDAHCATSGAATCVCDTGFRADATGACINVDNCSTQVCANGSCVDGIDDFSCNCLSGFTGTGTKQCTKATATQYCPANACTPGGTCNNVENWSCTCNPGFALAAGNRSCTNINDCPATCKAPNGTCTDGINTFNCACNPGFSGPACATDVCNPNPCAAGSTCSRTGTRCTRPDAGQGTGQDVITIGDSWMALTASEGIQYSLERISGRDYRNYGVAGTKVLDEVIPNQYASARSGSAGIKTVVMSGGSLDLLQDVLTACDNAVFDTDPTCRTRADQVVARLGQLWSQMAADGVRDIVMIGTSRRAIPLGLFPVSTAMAYLQTKMTPVCAGLPAPARCHLFDPDSLTNLTFRPDSIHPDAAGFDLIGTAVWQLMQAQGMRR